MRQAIIGVLVAIPIVVLALTGPVSLVIPVVLNKGLWIFLMLLFGFLGIAAIYQNVNIWARLLVVYLFANCFLSRAPYLSFILYGTVVFCFYYFVLCRRLKDFSIVFKAAQALFWLNVVFMVFQRFQGDRLFNYAQETPVFIGMVGTSTELGSFIACLAPFLLAYNLLNFWPLALVAWLSGSVGALVSLGVGLSTWGLFTLKRRWVKIALVLCLVSLLALHMAKNGRIKDRLAGGRWPVWKKTVQLANEHGLTGMGIGTYKLLFPVLGKDVAGGGNEMWKYKGTGGYWIRWARAHNCFLQLWAETGHIGAVFILGLIGFLIWLFILASKTKETIIAFSGLAMICTDMTVHFPTRTPQVIFLLIAFIAYYIIVMKRGEIKNGRI